MFAERVEGRHSQELFTLWGWWESNNLLVDFGLCFLPVGTPGFSDISVYSNGEFLDDMDEFGAAIFFSYKRAFADFPQGVYIFFLRSHDLAVFLHVLVSGFLCFQLPQKTILDSFLNCSESPRLFKNS